MPVYRPWGPFPSGRYEGRGSGAFVEGNRGGERGDDVGAPGVGDAQVSWGLGELCRVRDVAAPEMGRRAMWARLAPRRQPLSIA
jgi:hypothetical protein